MTDVDVFISGGGIAGLVAASALSHAGCSVLLADPTPERSDLRSTAYLTPARDLLEEIGLWAALVDDATPLDALRVMDTRGWPPEVTQARSFLPADLGEASFGWNLPNALTRERLIAHLSKQPGVELALGTGFASMLTRTTGARVRLEDGRRVRAQLVIGADGRASPVREAAGIAARTARYGQKALAFHATHALAHGNVSTEIYNQGGAFTTVPLPNHEGQPASAIVWMQNGPEAQRLAALNADAFNSEMAIRACGALGPMLRLSPPNIWPVVTQTADRLTAERTVLIAEAAHVLPPIGAQGLNTSLQDVSALYRLVRKDSSALGTPVQLDQYARMRGRDTRLRAQAIDLFNRVCQSGDPVIQTLRASGLKATHDITPLRLAVMRAGIAAQL